MKHEKPPSPPPVAFLPAPSRMSTYFATLLSPPLSNTIRESLCIPLSVPAVPTSNFECITGPPLTLSIPSSLRSDGDITITGT